MSKIIKYIAFSVGLILLISAMPAGETSKDPKALKLTDKTFEETISKGVVLVDFWATWCAPCRRQGPIIDQLSGIYEGRAVIAKLDVDANPASTGRYYVRSIPTIIVFKDGKAVERMTGLQSREKISVALDKFIDQKK